MKLALESLQLSLGLDGDVKQHTKKDKTKRKNNKVQKKNAVVMKKQTNCKFFILAKFSENSYPVPTDSYVLHPCLGDPVATSWSS